MDFGAVRALVVLPELPVAGAAVGGVASSLVLEELDDWRALPVESFVLLDESFVRGLVVLPEFVAVVGSFVELAVAEVDALPDSSGALFDFLLLALPVFASSATGVSSVGGIAPAEGSAAAPLFGLLFADGVLFAVSTSVFPALSLLVLDLLREEVLEPPDLFAALSVPAASFEPVFVLVVVFFEVVAFSPELASEDFAASVESAADFFFFFFVAVESLCDWSVDCGDRRPALACVALVRPQVSSNVINTADQELFFISVPCCLCEIPVPLPVKLRFSRTFSDRLQS
jgi:hypothetical protein